MTSLLLSLALSTPSTAVGQAPTLKPPPPIVIPAYRTIPSIVTPSTVHRHQPQAVTLDQFSRVFTPTPGTHRVWIVHPGTGLPVEVGFALPNGTLTEYEVNRRSIVFGIQGQFQAHYVTIMFHNNGTVDVRSR